MTRKKTTEEYVLEAKAVHGDLYDYSPTIYDGKGKIVTFLCRRCGTLCEQNAGNHLYQKQGCRACSYVDRGHEKRLARGEFIVQACQRFGDLYDYSTVGELHDGQFTVVEFVCNRCGKHVNKTAKSHLRGEGCKKCNLAPSAKLRRRTLERFLEQAKAVHGDRYDYSQVTDDHVATRSKINILCPKCDVTFATHVGGHLYCGHGCPICAVRHGGSASKPEIIWLDSLNVSTEHRQAFIPTTRWRVDALVDRVVYEFFGAFWHGDPRHGPPDKLNVFSKKTYLQLYDKTILRCSKLESLGYTVKFVWEADFLAGLTFSEQHPLRWPSSNQLLMLPVASCQPDPLYQIGHLVVES